MNTFKIAFVLRVSMASTIAQGAGSQIFKSYSHGAIYKDYESQESYYDCSEDIGAPALCKDAVRFLSHEFTAVLAFQEYRLQSVLLVADFSQPLYQRTLAALIGKFQLVMLQSSSDRLGLIQLRRSVSESEFTARISEFESVALNQGF